MSRDAGYSVLDGQVSGAENDQSDVPLRIGVLLLNAVIIWSLCARASSSN